MRHLVTIGAEQLEVELTGTGPEVEATVDGTPIRADITRAHPTWTVTIDDRPLQARVVRTDEHVWVALGTEIYRCTVTENAEAGGPAAGLRSPEVTAPMPGKVIEVAVEQGQQVAAGDTLIVLEAMKMETVLTAEAAATVARVTATAGSMVEPGQILVELAFD